MSFSIISDAMAAAPAGGGGMPPETLNSILLLVGFIIIFYFLIWRPQSKRAKEHKELISNLQRDDEVITSGGILGRINKVSNDFIVVTIANGVEVKLQKSAISAMLPKGTMDSI